MMECFIKKVFAGKGEEVHDQFIRFGKGRFENRAVLVLQNSNKIKLRGSFDWVNDFTRLVAELGEVNFSGIILSKEELDFPSKKKMGLKQYEVSEISSGKVKEIQDKAYALLLDVDSADIKLKTKKKLPKPGKSREHKVDDKFCQLEADLKFWPQIKEAFMLPECKKAKISHTIIVEQIILPEGEKDFAKIRELSKRKGKIIRKIEVDKQESKQEKDFIA